MKKLLAIILTVVCIIPTMAVSFSVSAKAASNQVKTTNVSLYQYGESTYTVNKSKSTQKYNYSYTVSNNNGKNIVVAKNDSKSKLQLTVGGNKVTSSTKPVITVYYKQGKKKVNVQKFNVTVKQFRPTDTFVDVDKTVNYTVDFPAKTSDLSIKVTNERKATADGNVIQGKTAGTTKAELYLNKSYFSNKKCVKSNKDVLLGAFRIRVCEYKPSIKENAEISLYYTKAYNPFSGIDNIRTYNDDKNTEGKNSFTFAKGITSYINEKTPGLKYQIVAKNSGIVGLYGNKVYSKSVGKTTANIYGIQSDGKTVNYGSLPVNVKKVSMAKIAQIKYENSECDIFDPYYEGNVTLSLSNVKTFNAKYTIMYNFLNTNGFSFNPSNYKVTFKCTNPKVASVSSNGIVTAKKVGSTKFTFTIKFSDGSTFNYGYETITVEK